MYASELGMLHIFYSCIALVGLPTVEARAASHSFTCSWDPFPSTGLPRPALIYGFVSSLTETCYACSVDIPRRLSSFFFKENGEEIDLSKREGSKD